MYLYVFKQMSSVTKGSLRRVLLAVVYTADRSRGRLEAKRMHI